jgi:hypothetical protein
MVVARWRSRSGAERASADEGGNIGDITIGRGAIVWHGANRQRIKRIPWSRFADVMNELAYGI